MGMIILPVLLVVVIVMAAMSGNDDEKRNEPPPVVENTPEPPPENPVEVDPGPAEKKVRPPTQAELDMLERSWAPLRDRARKMRDLRDEGIEYWHKQDKTNSQKKWHAANREWHHIRDTAQDLLGQFSPEQMDLYLSRYEIELIEWGKIYKTFSKNLDISE